MIVNVDHKAEAIAALRASILDTQGATDRATREAVFAGETTDAPYAGYVAKVSESSYKVTPSDFTTMADAGLADDAVFELTLAAAVGAASRRLDAALRAMGEEVRA